MIEKKEKSGNKGVPVLVNPKLIPNEMGTAHFGNEIKDVGGNDIYYKKKQVMSQKKEDPQATKTDDLCTR